MRKASWMLVGLAATIALVGCTDDDFSIARSNIELVNLNGGDPVQSSIRKSGSDMILGTADDFIPEDEVWVTFRNTPSDAQTTTSPGGPFSAVTMNRYRITFQSDVPIDPIVGGMHAYVVQGDSTGTGVVLMPAVRKQESPLVEIYEDYMDDVPHGPIESTAHFEFWGEEQTSGDEIYVHGYLVVNFHLYQ